MLYTIENEKLKVSISDKGAELQNIILKSDGTEYLWQGDERFWSGRAYNLFPICGRLTDGRYTYKGKTYNMNLHGFARASFFRAEMISDTKAAFVLTPDDEIRTQYPFDFLFRVTYSLNDTELTVSFDVRVQDNQQNYIIGNADAGVTVSATLPAYTWTAGNRYNYTVTIKGENVDLFPIEFGTPTVDGITDANFDGSDEIDVQPTI